jgi:hypothetical protein
MTRRSSPRMTTHPSTRRTLCCNGCRFEERRYMMDERMWPRLGAASGMLFVALLLGGDSVPVGDSVGFSPELFGLILFVPFLGYLFAVLRRAEGGDGWLSATAFGAGLVALAVKLASFAPFIAARKAGADTQIEGALIAMNDASFMLTLAPLGVMVAAASALIIRTGALPVWLGWAGAVTACALLVNSAFLNAEFGPAFLLFLLWTILTSAIMTRRASAGRTEGSTAPKSVRSEPVRR